MSGSVDTLIIVSILLFFYDIGNASGISYIIKNLWEDAHPAIRYIAARRHRGGAKVCKPLMSEGMGSPCGLAHFVIFCMIQK